MSTPDFTMRDLPHDADHVALGEDYTRASEFLGSIDDAIERERTNGNGAFFHIVADQWMELASLQYLFKQSPEIVTDTAKQGLQFFMEGLELGHPLVLSTVLDYFSAAVALNDPATAHDIASAPEKFLGLLDDPGHPLQLLVTAAFVLSVSDDDEARQNAELLRSILFESPLDKKYYPMKKEMAGLYNPIVSILDRDAAEFNRHLMARCEWRAEMFNQDTEGEKPPVVDWPALGLVCFALDRGLEVTTRHVYVPLSILEASGKIRAH